MAVLFRCSFYIFNRSLIISLIFILAIKYGDVVNRSISFVATSSYSLKGQLQQQQNKKPRLQETNQTWRQTLYCLFNFCKQSEHARPDDDCGFH